MADFGKFVVSRKCLHQSQMDRQNNQKKCIFKKKVVARQPTCLAQWQGVQSSRSLPSSCIARQQYPAKRILLSRKIVEISQSCDLVTLSQSNGIYSSQHSSVDSINLRHQGFSHCQVIGTIDKYRHCDGCKVSHLEVVRQTRFLDYVHVIEEKPEFSHLFQQN